MADRKAATEPRDYLIEKGGYFYRPNRAGYNTSVSAAGRYTKMEAEREAQIEPWHMRAVPLVEVAVEPDEMQRGWDMAVKWLRERADSHAGRWMTMDPREALKATARDMETISVR